MTDPIPRLVCECGWRRPLVGVTRTDGGLPLEELRVVYDCPECGRPWRAGEQSQEAAAARVGPFARSLARGAVALDWAAQLGDAAGEWLRREVVDVERKSRAALLVTPLLVPGGEVIVILDLDEGGRTVTNDVENVIADLASHTPLDGKRVIYRDTSGLWDEILVEGGRFASFAPIRARTIAEALERIGHPLRERKQ